MKIWGVLIINIFLFLASMQADITSVVYYDTDAVFFNINGQRDQSSTPSWTDSINLSQGDSNASASGAAQQSTVGSSTLTSLDFVTSLNSSINVNGEGVGSEAYYGVQFVLTKPCIYTVIGDFTGAPAPFGASYGTFVLATNNSSGGNSTVLEVGAGNVEAFGGLPPSPPGTYSGTLAPGPYGLGVHAACGGPRLDSTSSASANVIFHLYEIGSQIPPTVVTQPASGLSPTSTSAILNGYVDPNGTVTTAYFEYGTSTQYGTKINLVLAPNNGTAFLTESSQLSQLQSGTEYHYRIVATNSYGTSYGLDATFSTPGPPIVGFRSDVNGDHQIDFSSGSADQTSSTAPFRFWLNDDHDTGGQTDGDDLNDGVRDCDSPSINCIRDLEDFAMLNLQLPSSVVTQLHSGAKIVFSVTGTGSLHLVPVPRAGFDHLYDPVYAQSLTPYPLPGITVPSPITKYLASATASPAIPLDQLFTNPQSGDRTLGFLFEGVSTGDLVLSGTIVDSNGASIAQTENFYLHLGEITEFYNHFTVGNSEAENAPVAPTATELNPNPPDSTNPNVPYILYVHGWRMHTWERVKFAETAYKRLYWAGYRGEFGLFSWPTEWTPAPVDFTSFDIRGNYDRSEYQAWRAATGLRNLIDSQLESGSTPRVRLLGHSMGNIVASENLKLGLQKDGARKINSYIASQAATVASAYDVNVPITTNSLNEILFPSADIYRRWPLNNNANYFSGISRMTESGITNFCNPSDYALSRWRLNQLSKPDIGYEFSPDLNQYALENLNNPDADPTPIAYNVIPDCYAAFAFAAPASSNPLGAEPLTSGEVAFLYRLDQSPLDYGAETWQHSGEFRSTIQSQHLYWEEMLGYSGLGTIPPNPFTTTPSNFQNWGQMWFGYSGIGMAPQASFTGDGFSNLTKYAFGLNPLQSNGGPQVTISTKSLSGINEKSGWGNTSTGTNELAIDFWCAANLSDVTYNIQQSTDLLNWSTVATPLTVIATSGQQELVEADVPASGAAKQFFRVTATLNQSSSSSAASSKASLRK